MNSGISTYSNISLRNYVSQDKDIEIDINVLFSDVKDFLIKQNTNFNIRNIFDNVQQTLQNAANLPLEDERPLVLSKILFGLFDIMKSAREDGCNEEKINSMSNLIGIFIADGVNAKLEKYNAIVLGIV